MPWQRVASLRELETSGRLLPRAVGKVEIALAEAGGAWYAFEDRCTHAGCSFTGEGAELDGLRLECACHGSEFDIATGEVLRGPAEEPIATYPVRLDAEGLEVDL